MGPRRLSPTTEAWCRLQRSRVAYISAGHKDADLRNRINDCIDEGLIVRVVWTQAHTALAEKAKMTSENRPVAWANEKADGSAKAAIKDGAETAEPVKHETPGER